jgi:CRP/FNR family transcriptional regulator, cyclic AMP receptor protein
VRIGKFKVRPVDVAEAGLFRGVSGAAVEAVVGAATTCHYARGDCAMRQGERSGEVHLVVSGAFKASSLSASGQAVTLSIMGRHEVFGEMAFLDGEEHSASVTALTESCTLRMNTSAFSALTAASPSVGDYLARGLALRLRRLSRASERLALEDVSARLARQLLDLCERFGVTEPTGVRITLGLSQRELAELVGATRERVNRALAAWSREGLITIQGRDLVVRSSARLSASAGIGEGS